MSRRKRKNGQSLRDMFASRGRGKGLELTIRIDTELVHMLDAFRSGVEEQTGVQLGRKEVLEGLLRKVWKEKLVEAAMLGVGAPISEAGGKSS